MTLGNFGRPHGDNCIQMARTDSSDNTGHDKHLRIDTASLQGTADQAPDGAYENDFNTAEFVT
jgi:hypothetical protein